MSDRGIDVSYAGPLGSLETLRETIEAAILAQRLLIFSQRRIAFPCSKAYQWTWSGITSTKRRLFRFA